MRFFNGTWFLGLFLILFFIINNPPRVFAICAPCGGGCPGGQTCETISACVGRCVDSGDCTSNSQCGSGVCCQGQCVGAGECGGGGGGAECWGGGVNCPSGWTPAWNQPLNSFCKRNDWGTMCEPIGSAQQNSGCCNERCAPGDNGEEECWCGNVQATTYNCCPPGTADTCNIVPQGSNYTILREWVARYACEDEYDTFISTTRSNVIKWGPVKLCTEYDEIAEKCVGEQYWYTDYYYSTTCSDSDRICTCQSVCSNTAPTNVSVVQGASATSASVSWTVGTGGSSQRLYVDQSLSEVNGGCPTPSACEVNATLASGTNSYLVTGLLPNTTYYFRVTNYNSSACNIGATPISYTTPNVTLSGRVYLDTNNNCSTSTPWNLGGLTVSVRDTAYSGSVGSDGRFGFFAGDDPTFSYLDLSGYTSEYTCSTASGCNSCPTLTSVANPSTTNYFYLTPRREAWWQVVGGSVYSGGSVRSELPQAGTSLIESGAGGELGALMRASGTLDIGVGEVSSAGYSVQTQYKGRTMNYDYFAAHMGVTPNTINDWAADTMNKPANNPNKNFYYQRPSGSEASVTTPWTVATGESYVIFVNGDLRIASNITVEQGGFLAFVVNGAVRVSPAVTNIAGLYVVDGVLSTESNGMVDVPVEFQGSVVAWGGVNFGRDLVADNLSQAGEKFVYRPDLLTNMPDSMKVFSLKWEEVVPGTINR